MAFRTPWVADDSLVLIVAAGQGAREQARRFSLYHSHNHRYFRPAKFIGFYSDGQIDTFAEIDGPPEDDVIIAKRDDLHDLTRIMPETNGDPWEPHCLFRLRNIQNVGPIINNKRSATGRSVAWTQKQGYTTISALLRAKTTGEL